MSQELFVVGATVRHPVYGPGTIVTVEKKSRLRRFKMTTYKTINIGVKWITGGGPQGWAEGSNHPISELKVIS